MTAKPNDPTYAEVAAMPANGSAIGVPVSPGIEIMSLFQQAITAGVSLTELVDLNERMQRRNAELEFSRALVRFQARCPAIQKTSTGGKVEAGGTGFKFTYADYEEIASTVMPHLAAEGLSFSFDTEASPAMLKVTCTLRHELGHTVASSFAVPTDSKAPISSQQKFGGAHTYAKRMALIDVLGLTLTDPESPEEAAGRSPMTDEQSASLAALVSEVCPSDAERDAFCKFMRVASIADIPAGRYAEAVRALENKRKRGAK
jgi:hypothetical protein